MFEKLLGNLKDKFEESQQRKKEEKAEFARMQREVDFEQKRVFQEEFLKNSKEVAIAKAKRDAAKKSGVQKMRAQNRLRNLQKNNVAPGSAFSKIAAFTQRNLANREDNMKRTAERRAEAEKMKQERLGKNLAMRQTPRKPFGRF